MSRIELVYRAPSSNVSNHCAREEGVVVYVCICRAVSSSTVREVIANGARTVREVSDACGAGKECGRCAVHIRALLEEQHGPRRRGRLRRLFESQ